MRASHLKFAAAIALAVPGASLGFAPASSVVLTDSGTGAPGSIPEPAAWGMMIGGFAFAGGMLRRRKAVAALA